VRNPLSKVNQFDVRGEEGVQGEVQHKVGDEVHQSDNFPDLNTVRGCDRSATVDLEGLVDVQISFDNGDENLFEGSVEVQCKVQNEEDFKEEEQSGEEEESEEEEVHNYEGTDRETIGEEW